MDALPHLIDEPIASVATELAEAMTRRTAHRRSCSAGSRLLPLSWRRRDRRLRRIRALRTRCPLRSIVVLPPFRGRGFGRDLVGLSSGTRPGGGARQAFLLTNTARAVFERLGFTVVGRKDAPPAILATREASAPLPPDGDAHDEGAIAVGWAKRSVPTRRRSGGHAALCPPYSSTGNPERRYAERRLVDHAGAEVDALLEILGADEGIERAPVSSSHRLGCLTRVASGADHHPLQFDEQRAFERELLARRARSEIEVLQVEDAPRAPRPDRRGRRP